MVIYMPCRCVIIGAAIIDETQANGLLKIIQDGDYVICADGGYDTCVKAGIAPDLFVGDSDSVNSPPFKSKTTDAATDFFAEDCADNCKPESAPVETVLLPAEKDVTDLQAAIDEGLKRGFGYFVIAGCTGGRFDHHYAAVCMLEYLHQNGARGELTDAYNTVFFHGGGTMRFENRPEYKYISVVPLDAALSGVTLKGLKYHLNGAPLTRSRTLGVSNEFVSQEAEITIANGRGLVIYSKDI